MNTSVRPVDVAVVGFGLSGMLATRMIEATPGLELRWIVDADPGRRARARKRFATVRLADELAFALRDRERGGPTLVVNSTPNRWHAPVSREALEAGCHVVADKPVALRSAEALELARLADENGVLLIPLHQRRWDDDFRTLLEVAFSGMLGRLHRLEVNFNGWRPGPPGRGYRESGAEEDGGGLLWDVVTHGAYQAAAVLGPVSSVFAEIDHRRPETAVDDDVLVSLVHENGARSQLRATVFEPDATPRLRLIGERGAFSTIGFDPQQDQIKAGMAVTLGAFGHREDREWAWIARGGGERDAINVMPGRWLQFWTMVAEAIQGFGPPPVRASEGVSVVRLVEFARCSAKIGAIVRANPSLFDDQ